ncbi:MAG: hypothetical protein ACLUW6_09365 [Coriobacteriaceae bacterium]
MTDALNATGKKDPVELELWRPNNQSDGSSISSDENSGDDSWARERS